MTLKLGVDNDIYANITFMQVAILALVTSQMNFNKLATLTNCALSTTVWPSLKHLSNNLI